VLFLLARAALLDRLENQKGEKDLTLEEIRTSGKEVLTCKDVSDVLAADAYTLHLQAMEDPARLGFPVVIAGRRVKIPRRAFLRFMEGEPGA
jgi:hypothetical protein